MRLLLDLGNSRCKWGLETSGSITTSGKVTLSNLHELTAICPPNSLIEKVIVSSVAGEAINNEVLNWSIDRLGVHPVFATVKKRYAGVWVGYDKASNLGVDRWLAMLGARRKTKEACVIVDAGSAITVDIVASDGQHLGGYIVPGFDLMSRSLFSGTSDVKVNPHASSDVSPGKSTQAAVNNGLLLMVRGLIKESLSMFASDEAPQLVFTGGDAEVVRQQFDEAALLSPSLVLDGLSVVAAQAQGSFCAHSPEVLK